MPAPGTRIGGRFYRRPGARSQLLGDQLGGSGALPTGIVAIVGVLERGEPAVPFEISSADALKQKLPTTGPRLAKLLYQASKDRKIPGAPFKLWFVRVNPAAQASAKLQAGGVDVIEILAADWGVYGNQITAKVEAGTSEGKKYTFDLGSTSEVFDDVILQPFSLTHPDTTELSALTLTVDPSPTTGGIVVKYTTVNFALAGAPVVITPTKIAFDGKVTATWKSDGVLADPANGSTVTIDGIVAGAADSETLTHDGTENGKTTQKSFSDVTNVTVGGYGAEVNELALNGDSFNLGIDDYTTVKSVIDRLNVYKDRGYTVKRLAGLQPAIADLDALQAADAHNGATATATANLYELERRVNQQATLVTAARETLNNPDTETAAPDDQGPIALGGGAEGSSAGGDANWQAAIDALKTRKPINVVVPLSTDAATHELVRAHCAYMEGDGRDERNCYLGAVANETLSALHTRIIDIDNRNASLVGQEIQVFDATGAKVWRGPEYLAVLLAGLQASRDVGVPLTEKKIGVLDVRQKSGSSGWDPDRDAEIVIEKGVIAAYKADDGIRVLQQCTTYLDDHDVYTLVSPNESANESVKNIRSVLQPLIGDPDDLGLEDTLVTRAIKEYERQVDDSEIKNFDPDSIKVTAVASGYQLEGDVVPRGSVDFINVKSSLVREAA